MCIFVLRIWGTRAIPVPTVLVITHMGHTCHSVPSRLPYTGESVVIVDVYLEKPQ